MDTGVSTYVTNNIYCNLTLVGADFDNGVFGIVTPKQWIYAQDLDINILSLKEIDELDTLKQKWFQVSNCPDLSEKSTPIGIEDTGGLFLIFEVISILSLLLFIWNKRYKLKGNSFIRNCREKSSNKTEESAKTAPNNFFGL
ncbi:unnamed protein product [Rotaria socialis]|uniref:Uncharacterized protein n=1 Tax=Rotaria socialis TaxID=392032 RepID=A0A817ZK37_9BILA|nr:unnamed protein product [Rotaria socialis]CAF3433208.1 unnamed protein product [Rotaria socialis]CAF4469211.1 unnamed protein product [Rotaria socialis]CAF4619246.1 unnamed protein product [Rotaria socialis]